MRQLMSIWFRAMASCGVIYTVSFSPFRRGPSECRMWPVWVDSEAWAQVELGMWVRVDSEVWVELVVEIRMNFSALCG